MSIEDQIKEAMLRMLQGLKVDAVEVTSWDEDYRNYGACETCGPDFEYKVDIYYLDSRNLGQYYSYDGPFTDLIRSLT